MLLKVTRCHPKLVLIARFHPTRRRNMHRPLSAKRGLAFFIAADLGHQSTNSAGGWPSGAADTSSAERLGRQRLGRLAEVRRSRAHQPTARAAEAKHASSGRTARAAVLCLGRSRKAETPRSFASRGAAQTARLRKSRGQMDQMSISGAERKMDDNFFIYECFSKRLMLKMLFVRAISHSALFAGS